jgi:hypothetical protein
MKERSFQGERQFLTWASITSNARHHLFAIEMILAFALVIAIAFPVLRGGITGFVSVDTESQNISAELRESGEFILRSQDGSPLHLGGFGISGQAEGGVAVFLANSRGDQYLVYTNIQNASKRTSRISAISGASLVDITGAAAGIDGQERPAVALVIEPGSLLPAFPIPPGFMVWDGPFQEECIETCVLPDDFMDRSYVLRAYLADGAVLNLREIFYTVVRE